MSNYLNSFSVPLWKIINELGQKNKNIVFEGAQGSMLTLILEHILMLHHQIQYQVRYFWHRF